MNKDLLKVSLRQRALYLPDTPRMSEASPTTLGLATEFLQLGYTLSEPLLHALNALDVAEQAEVLEVVNDVMGTQLNWASLVKGWQVPTGETWGDHFVTQIANLLKDGMEIKGTTLPCGHLIPEGTFPLERYNGCPFCGRPFLTAEGDVFKGQGTKLRVLSLWGDRELHDHFTALLASPVPLDATQRDSLTLLLRHLLLPAADIVMKETRMLVIDELVALGRDDEAARLFVSPQDVLRYLWYRHTGRLQLVEPRTLLYIRSKNLRHEWLTEEELENKVADYREELLLRYDRPWCRRVAKWLNGLSMLLEQQLEAMHPKRRMWVRFIRALRLAEMARRPGYEQLRSLLDRFYRQDYEVWAGRVQHFRQEREASDTLSLLKQRPGAFARCLFSTMLWFGPQQTLDAFRQVIGQLPARLLLTLGAQADLYFAPEQQRLVRPLSSVVLSIPTNPLLRRHRADSLEAMRRAVTDLYVDAMRQRFEQAAAGNGDEGKTIYIDPQLDNIPVAVGDRSQSLQDTSTALQGTRFPVEGDTVRLFLQWGRDLPAQHLDMDLSCHLLTASSSQVCSYFSLDVPGAKHSGDIQQIPDRVGTAEYIELNLSELRENEVLQVVFTCNAYTSGALQPNLVVGWMDARHPMAVSNETGVAYDPSTVTHMVRIAEQNLAKGLIFGVLDVAQREITWLEMPFDGQTVLSINPQTVNAYLHRLRAKPSIGQLLRLKAEAQHLTITDSPDVADESYTYQWALDTAKVSQLLLG